MSSDELEELMKQITIKRLEIQKDEDKIKAVQIFERMDAVKSMFDEMLKQRSEEEQSLFYLDEQLLYAAVSSHFDDIYRFKDYSGTTWADAHKQAGYMIKWISRFKPIQVKENSSLECDNVISINAVFALFVGFSFLKPCVAQNITQDVFDHLVYTLLFRNFNSGKNWATITFLLERSYADREDI